MRLIVSTEHRFLRTPDGAVYSATGGREYRFWTRYLDVFDEVTFVGRVGDVAEPVDERALATGPGVSATPLPSYIGPAAFARRLPAMLAAWRRVRTQPAAYLFRVPSALATMFAEDRRLTRRPYGLEVVGDPAGVFAAGAVEHPLRPALKLLSTTALRRQCAGASAVAYVTSNALQRRYPPSGDAFTTHYSDVELSDDAFAAAPRLGNPHPESPLRIVTVGSLAQPYKGVDVLIDAVASVNAGSDGPVSLSVVGDGSYRAALERQAADRGVKEAVEFVGNVPAGAPVRAQLDRADLFVLASRTEGLPRVVMEAMARGLPCIGTNVGGMGDLLPAEALVPPGDAQALAERIRIVAGDADLRSRMAQRNLSAARDYSDAALRPRRVAFYAALREASER